MDSAWLPLKLLLTVAASFLIGLELEGRKAGGKAFSPGGVRTVPLISLAGFLLAVLGAGQMYLFALGMAILGVWLALLYRVKLLHGNHGMTTESYMLLAYILGGLVAAEAWWLVAALTVLMVLTQELKEPLEDLVKRLPEDELVTVAKFVTLSAVILPLMPNEPETFTGFQLNPRLIWWVVVAVAAISYASYILQRYFVRARHAVLLTGLLGGAYSSTMTTVILARRSAGNSGRVSPLLFAGSIVSASGVMHLRLLVLIGLFWRQLALRAALPLLIAAAAGIATGLLLSLWHRQDQGESGNGETFKQVGSPLELRAAFTFAAMFVAVTAVTRQAQDWLGSQGLLVVAGLSGLGVVDPFAISLTQMRSVDLGTLVLAVVLAASANHLVKGVLAAILADRRTGLISLGLLVGLAMVTLGAWAVLPIA